MFTKASVGSFFTYTVAWVAVKLAGPAALSQMPRSPWCSLQEPEGAPDLTRMRMASTDLKTNSEL